MAALSLTSLGSCFAGDVTIGIAVKFEPLGRISKERINSEVLSKELKGFVSSGMWPGYLIPSYDPATCDVDIYKVAYPSTISEQGNRKTIAYGLMAVPVTATGQKSLLATYPMVSYQHGTVFGKHEVPSDCFTTKYKQYDGAYETRLNVAQFAGHGYVLIAADYFGMGDSIEPEGYTVKASHQQACLDLYFAAQKWLQAQKSDVSDLFLAGWSQGGLVTMEFLEKLEASGIKVKAASTASAPADPFAAASALLFNPRQGKDGNTADAVWANTIFILSAFSYENYYSQPGLTHSLFKDAHWDAYHKIYTRDYKNMHFSPDGKEMIVDGVSTPTHLPEMFKEPYQNPTYFSLSEYGSLLKRAGAYQWCVHTPVRMYCGTQDEAFAPAIAKIAARYQADIHPGMISPIDVPNGNHRGTFLHSVLAQKTWFDQLTGR